MGSVIETKEETSGIVKSIAKDRCVVSINIGGTTQNLSFEKSLFYLWGQQCNGDLTNILEEEMEVHVSYKSQPQGRWSAVAVWVGEKPDLDEMDVGLEPIVELYNQSGIVDCIFDDRSFIVRADGMDCHVYVSSGVTYRDGSLVEANFFPVTTGDSVMFDAISSEGDQPGATHHATCAWIGSEPRLADRFKLRVVDSSAQGLETLTEGRVYGIVIVIPNDAVAFVQVEGCVEKVLLFRSSFSLNGGSIRDVVEVGGIVCMRLCFSYIFRERRQWYAVVAGKNRNEVDDLNPGNQPMKFSPSIGQTRDILCCVKYKDQDTAGLSQSGDAMSQSGHVSGAKISNFCGIRNKTSLMSGSGVMEVREDRFKYYGVISYTDGGIYVNRRDCYIDGRQCSDADFDSLGKKGLLVNFEAVFHPPDSLKFTYYATCVWIGEKPSLSVVAEPFRKEPHFLPEGTICVGQVVGFYLPDTAFIATKRGLFLYFLSAVCRNRTQAKVAHGITDLLKLLDFVEFKISRNEKFSLDMCAYDVRKLNKQEYKNAVKFRESKIRSEPISCGFGSAGLELNEASTTAVPFTPSYFSARRPFLLNGCGSLVFDSRSNPAGIVHWLGYFDVVENSGNLVHENQEVMFDIEFLRSESQSYCVRKTWAGQKPPSESLLASTLVSTNSVELDTSEMHRGSITSTKFHDCAIADIKGVPVLVTYDSIVTSTKCDPIFHSIEAFTSVGDEVVLNIGKETTIDGNYFKATACYKLSGRPTKDGKIKVVDVFDVSWQRIWGHGEYFQTGYVEEIDSLCVVKFMSSKTADREVRLDLSNVAAKRLLFLNGEPVRFNQSAVQVQRSRKRRACELDLNTMRILRGHEITFHTGFTCSNNAASGREEIKCAWIGPAPELPFLVKHKAIAPRSLICPNWVYEGIVDSFPLPTHAVCKVGILEVLLLLTPTITYGKMVGIVESHLKRGDRVLLNIVEQSYSKCLCLISALCSSVKNLYDDKDVLIALRGTIMALPRPEGKIGMEKVPIEVMFDRSSVLSVNGVGKSSFIYPWVELIDASMEVGTVVYFSAAKDLILNSYRAYEVWVGKLPN